ncbi:MAG: DNA mismatch repair protein, partial [Desulfosporosinus sp.]
MQRPKELYEKRRMYYAQRLEKLTQTINRLSNVRLTLFFAGCALAGFFYMTQGSSMGLGILLFTVVSFTALVFWHQKFKAKQKYIQVLYEICDQAGKRLAGEWKSFPDTGEDFIDPAHPYSEDLDLFGPSSLFQWINTAKTYRGREKLKEWLT